MFWLRHIEEVQLYLKAWFSSENSYVFTAATFMGFDDNEHLPFLLMGDKHVLDGPLSKYSEIRSKMPAGKDAEILYEQIGVAAEDNLKLVLNAVGLSGPLVLLTEPPVEYGVLLIFLTCHSYLLFVGAGRYGNTKYTAPALASLPEFLLLMMLPL